MILIGIEFSEEIFLYIMISLFSSLFEVKWDLMKFIFSGSESEYECESESESESKTKKQSG